VRRVNNEVEHAGVVREKRRSETVRRVNNKVEHAGGVRLKSKEYKGVEDVTPTEVTSCGEYFATHRIGWWK